MFGLERKFKDLLPYIIIGLLATLAYFPTFTGGFILDDNPFIKNNKYIRTFHPIQSYLIQEDGILRNGEDAGHTGYYRPLINLTYSIDYKIWGLKAPGFRSTNLILHLLTCFVAYRLFVLLINNRHAAFWSTLIFALHPVNTESVSWITSRNNILVTFFSISSFYFYIIGIRKKDYFLMGFSVLLFAGALFSKEFGLLLVPILFLYWRFLSSEKARLSTEVFSYIPFIIVLIFYFILRFKVTGSMFSPVEAGNFWTRVCYAPYLVAFNFYLALLPFGLHSFIIHYPDTHLSPELFFGLLVVILIVSLVWVKRNDKRLIFGLASFILALFPVLNIVPTSAVSLISMRWIYFPLAFLMIAVCWCLMKSLRKSRFITLGLCVSVTLYFGFYTYLLNQKLWHDEHTLYRQEVLNLGNMALAGGLAENLLDEKKYKESEFWFRIAIERYPENAKNYVNYSALLLETSRLDEAMRVLNKARFLSMPYRTKAEWHNNMGKLYFDLKRPAKALSHFRKSVGLWPDVARFWGNLGSAYGALGEYEKAVSALREGLEINPDLTELRRNLALAYRSLGKHQKAKAVMEDG